jgi:hypothetical protein
MSIILFGLRMPYSYTVTNSPRIVDGTITVAFNLAQPLRIANGGLGITAVGANNTYVTSNGTSIVFSANVPTGIQSVTASPPLTVQQVNGAPNISISGITGSGTITRSTSVTYTTPTINGSANIERFSGVFGGTVASNGTYFGVDTGGLGTAIICSASTKYIDFARLNTDYDCRFIYNYDGLNRLTIFTGGGHGAAYFSQAEAAIIATNIILSGAVSFSNSGGANRLVTTNSSNKLATETIPVAAGTGAIVRQTDANVFNVKLKPNTFHATNFTWSREFAQLVTPQQLSVGIVTFKPSPFDTLGQQLLYNQSTGIWTNNTGANVFVTLQYSVYVEYEGLPNSVVFTEVRINNALGLAKSQVAFSDPTTGYCQFKLGSSAYFGVYVNLANAFVTGGAYIGGFVHTSWVYY